MQLIWCNTYFLKMLHTVIQTMHVSDIFGSSFYSIYLFYKAYLCSLIHVIYICISMFDKDWSTFNCEQSQCIQPLNFSCMGIIFWYWSLVKIMENDHWHTVQVEILVRVKFSVLAKILKCDFSDFFDNCILKHILFKRGVSSTQF